MILLELFEAWWQRADTLRGVLTNGYVYYSKSIFFFFFMHPAYSFTLFVVLLLDLLNGWMIAILFFKTVDIFFKITLMKGLYEEGDLDPGLIEILDQPLSPWLFLSGAGLYPFLLAYGIA